MNFSIYINNDFSPISIDTDLAHVKDLFKILPFTHFPVVEGKLFKGMIGQRDVINYPENNATLKDLSHLLTNYHINSSTNLLELLSMFAQNDTDIIPVIGATNEYIGYFELDEIIRLFYRTPFLKSNGTTLLLEKDSTSFSMSELCQIIESNGIDILGIYISDTKKNAKTEITLRIETENVNEVLQSLRRYKYNVLNYNEADLLMEQLKENLDYLQKYLEI